jgi:tetratricopeptide (TPR) repeat protein
MIFFRFLIKPRFACGVLFIFGILLLAQNSSASTISGIVYDPYRNPLPDVDVELLDDLYRQIPNGGRTRTDSGGRYSFNNLPDGNYNIRVLPFRFDYSEQSQYVQIATLSIRGNGTGNVYEVRDFYLTAKKGSLEESELGVVFAQEVPKEAERVFGQAVREISKNRIDEGIANLRKAIDLFPKYYLALSQLGTTLALKGEYGEAAPLLLKAVEINPKSPKTLFYLGLSLHKLNYHKAAVTALTRAHTIAPASALVLLTLGSAERMEGKYEDAETHLLKAKKVSKSDVPDIHWELAQLYGLNMKKYKEAVEELEKYLKAGKYDDEHTKKVKKLIADFQEKANRAAVKVS